MYEENRNSAFGDDLGLPDTIHRSDKVSPSHYYKCEGLTVTKPHSYCLTLKKKHLLIAHSSVNQRSKWSVIPTDRFTCADSPTLRIVSWGDLCSTFIDQMFAHGRSEKIYRTLRALQSTECGSDLASIVIHTLCPPRLITPFRTYVCL